MHRENDTYAGKMTTMSGNDEDQLAKLTRYQSELVYPYLGSKVLEVGAGTGRFTQYISQKGNFENYTAVEPSPAFFEELNRRNLDNVRRVNGEANQLIADHREYFDTVFSIHVLEHIENELSFLNDCTQLLKVGGLLVIQVPSPPFLYSKHDEEVGHYRRYNKSMLRKLVDDMGCLETEALFYSNFIGALGSFYYSKLRKVNFTANEDSKSNFLKIYRVFSDYVIPLVEITEKAVKVPTGLYLTLVARKKSLH